MLNNFEEFESKEETVLEVEGVKPKYMYWIITGSVYLHKKIKAKTHKFEPIEAPMNKIGISDNLSLKHGPRIGAFNGPHVLACEDATMFDEELRYTLVSSSDLVAWRYRTPLAQNWHSYIKKGLKENSIEKYEKMIISATSLQRVLLHSPKAQSNIVENLIVKKTTKLNFPIASQSAQDKLKLKDYKEVNFNAQKYSSTHNPLAKHIARPLTGFVDKKLVQKLERVKTQLFTGKKDHCYIRSEPLRVIKQKEIEMRLS